MLPGPNDRLTFTQQIVRPITAPSGPGSYADTLTFSGVLPSGVITGTLTDNIQEISPANQGVGSASFPVTLR